MQQNNLAKPDFPNQSPQSEAGAFLPPIQDQVNQLRTDLMSLLRNQHHNGVEAPAIALETDIRGLFETVSSVPSGTPDNLYSQIKVYESGGTHRLYWYDAVAHAWRYTAGT